MCSDAAIGRSSSEPADGTTDEFQFQVGDLDFPTGTHPANVNSFLDAAAPGTTSVIFCTYQSAAVVGAALSDRRTTDAFIDVGIFDEAHKTVGEAGRAFSYCLTDRNIRLKKRLFFTATPRVMDSAGNRDEDGELQILSMDDEAAYGKRVYELGFAEAARRKLIVPYKVIISVVNDKDISSEQLQASVVDVGGVSVDASMVANRVALASAVERFGIRKAITFHRTVEEARVFSLLPDIVANGPLEGFEQLHVSGTQTLRHRNDQMSRFEACDKGFTSNAKCLTEGIDLPAVDLVAFMSPKESKVDIVQAAGRSMRLAGPDKTTGYILLPIHVNLELGESVNDAVQRSDFKTVFDVLRALMANDGEFDYLVRNAGDLESVEVERNQFLGGCVEFVGGSSFMDARGIYESIEARLSDGITQGKGSFDERLEQLAEFKVANGHCEVPYKHGQLGKWCANQRLAAQRPNYLDGRRQKLVAIAFRFDVRNLEELFESRISELVAFKAANGHCKVLRSYGQLGEWCGAQRKAAKKPGYPDDRRKRLLEMGFRFEMKDVEELFESKISELVAFKAANGHCEVPKSYGQLGVWCSHQREAAKKPGYPADRRQRLVEMGFRFDVKVLEDLFESRISELAAFKAANGHCEVPKSYVQLGEWCARQRKAAKKPGYPAERRKRLLEMGFRFSTISDQSSEKTIHAESPQDSDFPINEECEEGEASDSPTFK